MKDGGPAFPHEADYIQKDGGGYEFKVDFHPGMSLRDWFAGQAMAGMLSCQDFLNELCRLSSSKADAREKIAYFAFAQADAMLAASTEPTEPK